MAENKKNKKKGETADAMMRALNISDVSAQGVLGFERLRRLAQGNAAMAQQAGNLAKSYAPKAGLIGLAIEAGNTAWLASDPSKRARAQAEYESNSKKPALERVIEGYLNPSDMLYATGKTVYDTGKTYEAIQRREMDAENNALLRKIEAHEAQLELERKKKLEELKSASKAMPKIDYDKFKYLDRNPISRQSEIAGDVMKAIKLKR
jgi:hypothetical protein